MRVGKDVGKEIKQRWEGENQGGEWGEINQEMDGEGSTRSKWWRGEKKGAARRSCLVGSFWEKRTSTAAVGGAWLKRWPSLWASSTQGFLGEPDQALAFYRVTSLADRGTWEVGGWLCLSKPNVELVARDSLDQKRPLEPSDERRKKEGWLYRMIMSDTPNAGSGRIPIWDNAALDQTG